MEFIEKVHRIVALMGVPSHEQVELVAYQLKDVVYNPVGESIVAKRVYKGCPVSILHKLIPCDFIGHMYESYNLVWVITLAVNLCYPKLPFILRSIFMVRETLHGLW